MTRNRGRVVGMILKGYPRLSETFVLREILLLESLGVELRLFALRDPGERVEHDEVRNVRARVAYLGDDLTRELGRVLRAHLRLSRSRFGRWGAALGHAVRSSLRLRSTAPLKRFLQAGCLVERELLDGDVAHLYAHFANDPATVAFYAAWLADLGYSISAHAKDIFTEDREWLAEKIAAARFVVTCTEHNRAHLQALAAGRGRVMRCYHGLRLRDFAPGPRPSNPIPRLLSVGRWVPKKGFDVLIEAYATLRDRGFRFHATLVGEGPQGDLLRAAIARNGLQDSVELQAPMAQRELIERLRFADAFVLACQVEEDGDRDGIPNVLVEAMAMEVPVVSTRVSGIPELVEDGVNGLLVPARDPAALADALVSLLGDHDRARRLARAGRAAVSERFDSLANVGMIRAALEDAIGAGPIRDRKVANPLRIDAVAERHDPTSHRADHATEVLR